MTREQAIEDFMAQNAFIRDANTLGSKETLERNLLAIKALQEQEGKKENYPEYLKAAARELKTFCEFQSDQSRRCLECYFWNESEGCSIYNWPEYWEV